MLEIIIGKSSTDYKKKNPIQNNQNQWINMRKLIGFIMNVNCRFTCMIYVC